MSIVNDVFRAAALAVSVAAGISTAHAVDISGAGATFPYPIYAKWADAYKTQTDLNLNYQSIGSGGGIKQIKAKTVTFGASDKPLEARELQESGLVQFPMIMGGVVPVINVKGIEPGKLAFDGPTLAKIFMGDITKWDDPAIRAEPEREAAEQGDSRRPPLRRFWHDLPLHQLSLEGQPGVEGKDRVRHRGAMACRYRRQGQRGRGQHGDPDRRLHRLCRVCLRQAEQNDLRGGDQ